MIWKLDKNCPICPQIAQQLCAGIVAGEFQPGQRLMSVRELAVNAGVNPNTVQRAFEQLEHQGILRSERSTGWFVGPDIHTAVLLRQKMATEKAKGFFREMERLGLSVEEVKNMVKEWEV